MCVCERECECVCVCVCVGEGGYKSKGQRGSEKQIATLTCRQTVYKGMETDMKAGNRRSPGRAGERERDENLKDSVRLRDRQSATPAETLRGGQAV